MQRRNPDIADINNYYLRDESSSISELLKLASVSRGRREQIQRTAAGLVRAIREGNRLAGGLRAFLQEYDLSSHEGVVLMCLAESLLRIPDNATMDALIADKLSSGNWHDHIGSNKSLFVNASTWALMLTGQLVRLDQATYKDPAAFLARMVTSLEEPVVRSALRSAMYIMGHQFVMGQTITAALKRSRTDGGSRYRYSFDMLGEAALTAHDADRYQDAYNDAITRIGSTVTGSDPIFHRPGISVKLSALCPRFEYSQKQRAVEELSSRLLQLAVRAREQGISLTVDAEECDRLELTLRIFEAVYGAAQLHSWQGLGIAVQSYQKRAVLVLRWLEQLAAVAGRVIPVRLVKGAYWDTEIKACQERGLRDYPVFTRKCNTDVSYLACARILLDECPHLYPQFATHNAHTLAYVYHTAGRREYEFQRLHGMGEELYDEIVDEDKLNVPCRIYAPVGSYYDLLPYLVRRLLENGANTSFVNQAAHNDTPIEKIIADPVVILTNHGKDIRHPGIPRPTQLYGERINSRGLNFADDNELFPLLTAMAKAMKTDPEVYPLIGGLKSQGRKIEICNPAQPEQIIGTAEFADAAAIIQAIDTAASAWPDWNNTDPDFRAGMLDKAADLYEEHTGALVAHCVREAGKTIPDSHAELREAVDLLRYYAACCRHEFSTPMVLPGPAGESNQLRWRGRGVFLCISPWNFPLAIYTGQIAAALAAGNTVLAKPAEQTPLTAGYATQLLYQAGIPSEVLSFVPAAGTEFGQVALCDNRIAGIAFTGSIETARHINLELARRTASIPTLIAETGGLNVMIADSSALPDQLIRDIVQSAFNSAGQRCSALRVLYLQDEIYDRTLETLAGRMDELVIGDPNDITTDIGPVIEWDAKDKIDTHIETFSTAGKLFHRCRLNGLDQGFFVSPAVVILDELCQLQQEIFGPVLHVIRYKTRRLNSVIEEINASGYGLTLGIHSRIESRIEEVRRRLNVGNVYVNRNMIGAVTGVQPFGGMGLSGTGPKAGGPNYLKRFAVEQTVTINLTAAGGNATLLSLSQ